jgi:hypothetical protein
VAAQKPTEKDIMDTRFQLHSDSGLAPASADAKLHPAEHGHGRQNAAGIVVHSVFA